MWEINLNEQTTTFLLSLFLGVIFCIIFDFTRGLRIFGLSSKPVVFLTDIIYFLIVTFLNFCFLLTRELGQIRGYVFVGELIGFFLFRITFSRFLIMLFKFSYKIHMRIKPLLYRKKEKLSSFFKEKYIKIKKKSKKPPKKLKNHKKRVEKGESDSVY